MGLGLGLDLGLGLGFGSRFGSGFGVWVWVWGGKDTILHFLKKNAPLIPKFSILDENCA